MGQKERGLGDVVSIFRFSFGGVVAEVQTLFGVMFFLPLVECLGELICPPVHVLVTSAYSIL